jgi:GNAT superfamily N-acetyltransferase
MPSVQEVDPHDADALSAWYAALREGAMADRTAPLLETFEAMARSFRNPGSELRRLPIAALDGQETVGAMLFELPLKENLTTAFVEIDVPPRHRRRGVGTALWERATRRAATEGRTIFQSEINVPEGHSFESWSGAQFAHRLGFASRHVEDRLVLALPVATGALDALEACVAKPDGYELISWAGPCPDEHLQVYADMQTAMSRDVPTGGLTREGIVWDVERARTNETRRAQSYLTLVSMARTTAGEPAGYTLIFVPRNDPDHASQDDTFVASAHRGHNLGSLLKVANLRQLERHRDGRRWLHTWTADTNRAMQTVNARFGFRPVEKTHEVEKSL